MNSLTDLLSRKPQGLLSIFFTAGYPQLHSTGHIIQALERHGVDMVEVGIPYSDPLADGPVIQHTSAQAIANGMTLATLFDQLDALRGRVSIPLILMGYLNPVLQLGMEQFCRRAAGAGVAGVILPDMPLEEYEEQHQALFREYNLRVILLVTPSTKPERVRRIDALSEGFIYAVSSSATTGRQSDFTQEQKEYLQRLRGMGLRNPVVVGFGIHNPGTLRAAWGYAQGAIVGTAFVRLLPDCPSADEAVGRLLNQLGVNG